MGRGERVEDTTRAARELVDKVIAGKTASERLLMCAEMYEEAKEFARIGMPEGLTVEEQDTFIFKRIHGKTPWDLVNS
jgi:hypothetical protein